MCHNVGSGLLCALSPTVMCVFMHVLVCMKEGEGERASEHVLLALSYMDSESGRGQQGFVCCHGNVRQA